jgi:hypothetical protein
MVRYVISCEQCRFRADATEIRGLGSQLIAHASICHTAPSLVIADEHNPIEVVDRTKSNSNSPVGSLTAA